MSASSQATPTVLLLGWRVESFQALSDLGAQVVTVLRPRELAELREVDPTAQVVLVDNPADIEQLTSALDRDGRAAADFDLVCTWNEFALVPAGLLVELGAGSGLNLATAIAVRDKFVQKRAVRAAGVPVADSDQLGRLADLRDWPAGFPIVVKPIAGAATWDTFVLRDKAEVDELIERIGDRALDRPWLVEQFVPGDELHLDGVVRDGRIEFLAVGSYFKPLIAVRERGLIGSVELDPSQERQLYADCAELADRALAALGLRFGVFHLEAFRSEQGLVFGECAGRLAGGLVADAVQRQFGVALEREWARVLLDRPAVEAPEPDGRCYGWIHLTGEPGATAYPGPDEIAARPGVAEVIMSVKAGQALPDTSVGTNVRVGQVLLRGRSPAEVAELAGQVDDWFRQAVAVRAG